MRKLILYPIAIVLIAAYAFWLTIFRPSAIDYRSCDFYTTQLNGGIQMFEGTAYRVVLCGLRGRIDPTNIHSDEVRLQIFSENNELLLERHYHPQLGMGEFGLELNYSDNHISYETEDQGPTKFIAMPPNRLDWLHARLPRLWP